MASGIDLRKLWAPFDPELERTPPIDVDATIYYTLRELFDTGADFESRAIDRAEAVWRQEERVAA